MQNTPLIQTIIASSLLYSVSTLYYSLPPLPIQSLILLAITSSLEVLYGTKRLAPTLALCCISYPLLSLPLLTTLATSNYLIYASSVPAYFRYRVMKGIVVDDKFIIHAIALWSVVNAGMIKVLLHLLWVLVVVTSPLNKVRLPLSVSKIFERKGNSRRGKVHHQPQNERRKRLLLTKRM